MARKAVVFGCLAICLIFTFAVHANPSGLDGRILDKEDNHPLDKSRVYLFRCEDSPCAAAKLVDQAETGGEGGFQFAGLDTGRYFLVVLKEGYAAFGPFYCEEKFKPNSSWSLGKNPIGLGKFDILAGKTKYIEVYLNQESVLNILVSYKLPENKEYNCEFNKVIIHHTGFENAEERYVFSGSDNLSKFYKPGQVRVQIIPCGFPEKEFIITLKDNSVETIHYELDFTQGQVLHGIIRQQEDQKPVEGVEINLLNIESEQPEVTTISDQKGQYWLGGFPPGKYKLWIYSIDQAFEKEEIVEFDIGENKEINHEFKVKD